ncbi:MAG: lysine--tRNA ligase, partial [Oscillospiraceae bacterium]|nr:lysine--tRNA ligase [Oscillospiraceae bacterium]
MSEQNHAPQVEEQPITEAELSELLQIRHDRLQKMKDEGRNPFEITTFDRANSAQQIVDEFEELEGKQVKVAGRIMSWRTMGKATFMDLHDHTGKIQLYIKIDAIGEENYQALSEWDIGDIIGVTGEVFRTRRGEISIKAENMILLSKSLRPLPNKWQGLKDTDLRFRQRYVDLIVNPEVKRNFIIRSKFIKFMRNYLDNMNYIEVETPVLNTIAGGASARPFITHHNTLDIDMFMRIATELPLKRLIVGGMDRVYEIGRIFRNEGMDPKHNPEFTSVELYQAYADFHDMMDIAEGVYTTFAQEILGTYEL